MPLTTTRPQAKPTPQASTKYQSLITFVSLHIRHCINTIWVQFNYFFPEREVEI